MSTLQVANVHLESTANNRIQFLSPNTVQIYAGGTLVLSANSTGGTIAPNLGQQTIWVPASSIVPNVTTGPGITTAQTATTNITLRSIDYDAATAEFAQFGIQMPKSWNEGTVQCQFVWYQPTTSAGAVVWGIQSVSYANTDSLTGLGYGTAVTVTSTGGTGNTIYISPETSAMTVAGSPTAEEYVMFNTYRDATNGSDTLAVDARLLGVKIHYTVDAGRDD